MINDAVYYMVKPKRLFPLRDPPVLRTASGEVLEVGGKVYLPFSWNGTVRVVPTLVIPNLAINCVCGMDFWKKFQIQPTIVGCAMVEYTGEIPTPTPLSSSSVLTASEQQTIDQIKTLFIPARPGRLTTTPLAEHSIGLAEEWRKKPPVKQFPYVMSPKTQGLVSVELQRLLDAGIIEPSHSDWSLNCVPVIKPHKVRLCLDARKINERTVRDAYPLPHPCRILGQLPKAKYLSTIDLSEAFLQVPLEKSSRKYTAFSVQG